MKPMSSDRFDQILLEILSIPELAAKLPLCLFDTPVLATQLRGENEAGLTGKVLPVTATHSLPCDVAPQKNLITKHWYLSLLVRSLRTINSLSTKNLPYRRHAGSSELTKMREQKRFQVWCLPAFVLIFCLIYFLLS